MGLSSDYPNVPDWTYKPEGYQTGTMVKYEGNVFRAAFWASEPGKDDPAHNGWRLYDELYDLTSHTPTAHPQIAVYIPTWRSDLDTSSAATYQNITHALVAFLMFSEVTPGALDPQAAQAAGSLLATVVPAGQAAGTKIGVALGGATDYGFLALMERAAANPDDPAVTQAAENVAQFVTAYSLDHVDLDLECWWDPTGDPGKDQGGRLSSAGPHPAGLGLTAFASQLRQALLPGITLSATLPATSWYGNNFDGKIAEQVDWLGIMTYDLTGSWNASPVGPHTALTTIRQQEGYAADQQGAWPGGGEANNPILSVEESLWYWTNPFYTNWQGPGQKLPRNKVMIGVPLYGYDFAYAKDPDPESGQIPPGYKVLRYKDILTQFPDAAAAPAANIKVAGSTPRPSFTGAAGDYPYAHNIYFETPATAVRKMQFLKSVGAQGIIIWEASGDVREENKSVIKALYSASGNVPSLPVVPPAPGETASTALWDATGFLGEGNPDNLQFQDDGIVRPGVRQYSARLWNIPGGEDWVAAANRAPAVIKKQYFPKPTRIVDKHVLGLWGEFDVRDTSDVPDWGTFYPPSVSPSPLPIWDPYLERGDAPPGYTRYTSRLWNIKGDWKTAANQTPAVINGQYFDRPTIVRDLGIRGLYGDFDVSNAPAPLPASPAVMANGPNGYCYCMCNSTAGMPQGNVTLVNLPCTMDLAPGTPYLYAVLTKDDGSVDFPASASMVVQGPDGTFYDHDVQTDSLLVMMAGASVRCLIVKDPQPGNWTMTMQVPPEGGFHCECNTVPSQDVYDTVTGTLQRRGLASDSAAISFGGLATLAPILAPELAGPAFVVLVALLVAKGVELTLTGLSPNDQAQRAKAITTTTTAAYNQGGKRKAAEVLDAVAAGSSTKRKKEDPRLPAFLTWNMQGANWTGDVGRSKWNAVKNWLVTPGRGAPYRYILACLQEAGQVPNNPREFAPLNQNPDGTWPTILPADGGTPIQVQKYLWVAMTSRQAEAAGGQATLYILFYSWDTGGGRVNLAIVSTTGVDGEQVVQGPYRPVIGVQNDGAYFFTIHAAAGQSQGGDASTLLAGVAQQITAWPWWVAGDYNQDPNQLRGRLARRLSPALPTVCDPNDITRPASNARLDYAVRQFGAGQVTGQVSQVSLSDHRPVVFPLS